MIDQKNEDEILNAIELLYFGYRAFTDGPDAVLKKRGLNRSHHRILYFVAHRQELSIGALLNILGISKQALNTPLRQLISMGMVQQRKSPNDARVKILALTSNGRQLEKSLTRSQRGLMQAVLSQAGPNASVGWYKVMQELADDVDGKKI